MNRTQSYFFSCCLLAVLPSHSQDKHDHAVEERGHEAHVEESEEGHSESAHEDADAGHGEESHGHSEVGHDDEKSPSVGPGLAILEADENRGIKLSEKATKRIQIAFKVASSSGNEVQVPCSGVINQRGESILYIKREDWLTMIRIKVLRRKDTICTLSNQKIKAGDLVVSENAGLVRLAHLEAFGASGDGHGH